MAMKTKAPRVEKKVFKQILKLCLIAQNVGEIVLKRDATGKAVETKPAPVIPGTQDADGKGGIVNGAEIFRNVWQTRLEALFKKAGRDMKAEDNVTMAKVKAKYAALDRIYASFHRIVDGNVVTLLPDSEGNPTDVYFNGTEQVKLPEDAKEAHLEELHGLPEGGRTKTDDSSLFDDIDTDDMTLDDLLV